MYLFLFTDEAAHGSRGHREQGNAVGAEQTIVAGTTGYGDMYLERDRILSPWRGVSYGSW